MALSTTAIVDDPGRASGPSGPSGHFSDNNRSLTSAVSWAAITAGAAAAASLSLILLILGVGLGLSSVSPWARGGVSATTFGVSGGSESMQLMCLLAVTASSRSIDLSAAYFVPDDLTLQALLQAMRRGVRLRIVVPGKHIDSETVRSASRATWGPLLAAGAVIAEYGPTMYHCKVLIVDGLLISVGSTNFDNRSFRLNDEATLNVVDASFVAAQTTTFENDLSLSRRVSHAERIDRPMRERLVEALASAVGSLATLRSTAVYAGPVSVAACRQTSVAAGRVIATPVLACATAQTDGNVKRNDHAILPKEKTMNTDTVCRDDRANRDPISSAPGAHPVATGVGAIVGGAAAGAFTGTVAGPVGTVIGAAVGAVVGGLAGKDVAEAIDPTREDAYWRENYGGRRYVNPPPQVPPEIRDPDQPG